SRRRLGQAPRADLLPARERREVLPLLLFAAEERDVRGAQAVVRRHGERDRRVDARELLDADAVVDGGHRGAAVLLGELDAHEAERREAMNQLDREVLRLVPLADVRTDFGFGELADAPAQQRLLVRRTEVHKLSNFSTFDGARSLQRGAADTGAIINRYECRPVRSRNATPPPSIDHAGKSAPFVDATTTVRLSRSSS